MKQFIKYLLANIYALFCPNMRLQLDVAQPIFILGCGHSGTSVLLAILDSHSQIQAIGEETQILQFETNPRIIRWKFHRKMKEFTASRWVEKTPRHVYHIANIFRVFPTAKIILLIRDGRDVACSIKKRYGNFEQGVERWIKDNEAARPFWGESQLYALKLEDLQNDPTSTLQGLTKFLEVPFEKGMLTFHEQKRFFYDKKIGYTEGSSGEVDHSQRRNWQINQPLQKSTSRWQTEMSESEKQLFKQKAQYLLEEFGYVRDSNW